MEASLASSMVAEANVCRSLEARGPGRVEAFWATIVNGARTAANVLSARRAVRDHDAGVSLPRAVLGQRADECELGVRGGEPGQHFRPFVYAIERSFVPTS